MSDSDIEKQDLDDAVNTGGLWLGIIGAIALLFIGSMAYELIREFFFR